MKRVIATATFALAGVLVPLGALAGPASQSAADTVLHHPLLKVGAYRDTVASTNWSGYAVQATSQFTEAVGTWVQPTASCTTSGATYASFWVGIDGYTSNSVEQLGTDSDCITRGVPNYYAWYEMYPAGSVEISTLSHPVEPGDTLTATVSRSGTSYTLSLASSEGWTYSVTKTASDANASAEWVAESPEICSFRCKLANLTNFGTVSFSASEAADGAALSPIAAYSADGGPHEITMVTSNGATTRAQPSPLGTNGQSFTVAWEHD